MGFGNTWTRPMGTDTSKPLRRACALASSFGATFLLRRLSAVHAQTKKLGRHGWWAQINCDAYKLIRRNSRGRGFSCGCASAVGHPAGDGGVSNQRTPDSESI